jgi:hypothetical protein
LGKPIYAYLHNVYFETYARNFVKRWHNDASFRGTDKLKCQIEYEQGQVCMTDAVARNTPMPVEEVESSSNIQKTDLGISPGQTKVEIVRLSLRYFFYVCRVTYNKSE